MQSLEILTVQFSEDGVFNTTFSFFQYFCQPFLQTRLSLLALKKQEGGGGGVVWGMVMAQGSKPLETFLFQDSFLFLISMLKCFIDRTEFNIQSRD